MRGTRTPASRESVQNGIIPAYAGNTSLSGNLEDFGGDHPRVCGEHVRNDRAIEARAGSSPRMRGTPAMPRYNAMSWGIIPAYAGNTPLLVTGRLKGRDHPRVCGEHSFSQAKGHLVTGSSPRMRGTLVCMSDSRRLPGIIPAYAGNTRLWCPPRRLRRDHPRVCGEHRTSTDNTVICSRIIPAYAGNTIAVRAYAVILWDHPRVCGEHIMFKNDKKVATGSSPRMRGTR